MAINVSLYTFKKRENSTKRPSGSGSEAPTTYQCTLIDDTSLMNPTFKLSIANNPIGKNYCYVSDFNRYYFITDIRSYQNFWYISCKCDVLASFKTEIGPQYHYVLRAASDSNGDINDDVYPCTTNVTTYVKKVDTNSEDPLDWDDGHCYILGVVGKTPNINEQFGSVIYYVMSAYALKAFITYLMDNVDSWSNLAGEYTTGVQKALINPIQYIKSCICMPFSPAAELGLLTQTVHFGYYYWSVPEGDVNIVRRIADNTVVRLKEIAYIDVQQHPQAATRGAYLNCQPYTRYTLHFGPWGDIDLDPMLVKGNNKIRIETLYDLIAGTGRLLVTGNVTTSKVMFNGNAKVGVDINLSQVYKDALSYEAATTKTLFGSVAAAANLATNPLGGVANGLSFITAGVQDMTRLNYPTVAGVGSSGSFISFKDPENLYLLCKFNEIVEENNTEIGRPLCKIKQLNTLSGYILCQYADAQITGTADEAVQINNYLNTGFFYE